MTAGLKSGYPPATVWTWQHTSAVGTVIEASNTRKGMSGVLQTISRWRGLGNYKLVQAGDLSHTKTA